MTTLSIIPAKSVNGIEFGSRQADVETSFGRATSTFKKTKWSKGKTADYGSFHIYYDAADQLEAIEIFGGTIELPSTAIKIPATTDEVLKALPSLKSNEYGFTSESESIGAYAEDDRVISILFGKPDYYA